MAEPSTPRSAAPGAVWLTGAWLGAAAFVFSLGLFLYAYVAWFGATDTGPWIRPAAVNAGLFSVFALHHSILARAWAKRLIVRTVPSWFERSLFTWVASLLFIAVVLEWQTVPGVLYRLDGPWRAAGYAAQAAGLAITALGSSALDVLDLAGVRPVLDARGAAPPRHVPLETQGIYRLVRHPVYFGWVLIVFGAPDMTATRATFAIVSTAYLVAAIPFEERSLGHVFGDAYRAYQARTRWRMVPGIW